jgi:hypothetical protein
MASVGREGMAGLHVVLESEVPSLNAVVHIAGALWRTPVEPFRRFVASSSTFRRTLLRYADAFFTDAVHTATCNSLRRVNQRCGRWLLSTRDRVRHDRLHVSARSVAEMLRAHRDRITFAMRTLHDEKISQGHRGYLDILDPERLMQSGCSCYGVTKARFAHLSGASS